MKTVNYGNLQNIKYTGIHIKRSVKYINNTYNANTWILEINFVLPDFNNPAICSQFNKWCLNLLRDIKVTYIYYIFTSKHILKFMAPFILNVSLRFITGSFERKSTISVVYRQEATGNVLQSNLHESLTVRIWCKQLRIFHNIWSRGPIISCCITCRDIV